MFDRFGRSWSLITASAALVSENRSLLLFPVFSGLAMLATLATFIAPLAAEWDFDVVSSGNDTTFYVWAFLLYVAFYLTRQNPMLDAFSLPALVSGHVATLGAAVQLFDGRLAVSLAWGFVRWRA